MDKRKSDITTIDAYIAMFPEDVKNILREMRKVIKEAAPYATEKISYQMPTFYLEGNLVHFAAFKDHIGFFPTSSGVARFLNELSPFKTSKGTIRFPLGKPIPYDLVTRIVRFRVDENMQKAEVRRKGKH